MTAVEEGRAQARVYDYDISETVDGAVAGAGLGELVEEPAAGAAVIAGEREPGAASAAASWPAADGDAVAAAAAARRCSAADIGPSAVGDGRRPRSWRSR